MKRTHLRTAVLAAFLCTATGAFAQPVVSTVTKIIPKVDFGVKVGANFQELSGNLSKQYNGGVVGGLFLGVHKKRMGVQVEALVKNVNYDISYYEPFVGNTSATVNTVALDIPVLFEYRLFWRIWGQAGPQFTALLSAKDGSNNVKSDFNTTDFAGVIGLEAHAPFHINVGVRYLYGVLNINKSFYDNTTSMHNRTIQAYVGWRFI